MVRIIVIVPYLVNKQKIHGELSSQDRRTFRAHQSHHLRMGTVVVQVALSPLPPPLPHCPLDFHHHNRAVPLHNTKTLTSGTEDIASHWLIIPYKACAVATKFSIDLKLLTAFPQQQGKVA